MSVTTIAQFTFTSDKTKLNYITVCAIADCTKPIIASCAHSSADQRALTTVMRTCILLRRWMQTLKTEIDFCVTTFCGVNFFNDCSANIAMDHTAARVYSLFYAKVAMKHAAIRVEFLFPQHCGDTFSSTRQVRLQTSTHKRVLTLSKTQTKLLLVRNDVLDKLRPCNVRHLRGCQCLLHTQLCEKTQTGSNIA